MWAQVIMEPPMPPAIRRDLARRFREEIRIFSCHGLAVETGNAVSKLKRSIAVNLLAIMRELHIGRLTIRHRWFPTAIREGAVSRAKKARLHVFEPGIMRFSQLKRIHLCWNSSKSGYRVELQL
jgi:ribonuclease BN (tRNA processing enzyme)